MIPSNKARDLHLQHHAERPWSPCMAQHPQAISTANLRTANLVNHWWVFPQGHKVPGMVDGRQVQWLANGLTSWVLALRSRLPPGQSNLALKTNQETEQHTAPFWRFSNGINLATQWSGISLCCRSSFVFQLSSRGSSVLEWLSLFFCLPQAQSTSFISFIILDDLSIEKKGGYFP